LGQQGGVAGGPIDGLLKDGFGELELGTLESAFDIEDRAGFLVRLVGLVQAVEVALHDAVDETSLSLIAISAGGFNVPPVSGPPMGGGEQGVRKAGDKEGLKDIGCTAEPLNGVRKLKEAVGGNGTGREGGPSHSAAVPDAVIRASVDRGPDAYDECDLPGVDVAELKRQTLEGLDRSRRSELPILKNVPPSGKYSVAPSTEIVPEPTIPKEPCCFARG
jgi:hypothetical protein